MAGESVACVSDAGLPGIADPGADLARRAIAAGIPVTVLPGANAALTGLIASGLDTVRFSFAGFLPRTREKRRELLAELSGHRETLIFYEAPHRLADTLKELAGALGGGRPAVLCRELTKKYEEYRRGPLAELLAGLSDSEGRGEFVIVVGGRDTAPDDPEEETDGRALAARARPSGRRWRTSSGRACRKRKQCASWPGRPACPAGTSIECALGNEGNY